MGSRQSANESRVSPQELSNGNFMINNNFENSARTEENYEEKKEAKEENERPSGDIITVNRHCTDIFFLLFMIAFVIVLIGLVAYCMSNGDIYRIINGYDDCGNVCGRMNRRIEGLGCSGADRTNQPFLLVDSSPSRLNPSSVFRQCVRNCEERGSYKEYLNRCLPIKGNNGNNNEDAQNDSKKISFFSKTGISEFFQEVSEDLEMCWIEILILCLISFVISITIVFALRFIAGIIVWMVLVGIIVTLISATIFLWVNYKYSTDEMNDEMISDEKRSSYLGFAIVTTIATICICLIIFALRKRIGLVIELFKEAGKALIAMPLLLFQPILTFIALTCFASLWLFFAVFIESAGIFVIENNDSARYSKDSTILVTRWYNLLALFWFVNFVIGCQHMVIAGAVARWFFTRVKMKLSSPISRSFNILIRYHLGTVSMGSFFIALVNLIRVILKSLEYTLREPRNKIFEWMHSACQCCLYIFENFLKYLTRNSYIETAITGEGFCDAGKRAFQILSSNALRVFAINSIGDFVLLLAKGLIVLVTLLIGIELIQKKDGIYHSWIPLAIAGLFAYLVAHCFISVYEMTIDTIFICFCEDCETNDGLDRPYYMSRGLMEFVQNSKKLLQVHDEKLRKAWNDEIT